MRFQFRLKHLFWLTFVVAFGIACWMAGERYGHENGRNEVNRMLLQAGSHAIFRIDDNGKHFVLEESGWVMVPDPPAPPPPPQSHPYDALLDFKSPAREMIQTRQNGLILQTRDYP